MITKYVSVPDFSADKSSVINYIIALLFILLMTGAAVIFEDNEIILPEIAAMAVALWVYKSPEWVAQADKIFIILMYFLQAIFSVKIPAVYAFPFLVFVFPAESVIYLPAGSLMVSVFSLGAAFLIKRKLTI